MKTNCPYCGKIVATDFEVAIGQHVVCPWCERKFSYGEPQEKPARIEVPKVTDEGEQTHANVRCSHCGAKFEVEKNALGKLIKCKTCGKFFVAGRKVERPKKDRPEGPDESNRRDDQVTFGGKLKEGLPRIGAYLSRSACWIVNKWRVAASDKPLRIEYSGGESPVAVMTGEVMPSVCQVRFGMCPSLGSLLCRFPVVLRLMFRERYVIRCSHCSAIDVVYVSKQDEKVTVSCDCGYRFDIKDGRLNYLSWLDGIVGKIKRRQAVDEENVRRIMATDQENEKRKNLRDEFAKQLKIFEEDWLAYSDPKAEIKISRVKELTDRFYKKLSVANANKLYHAQHTNTRLTAMYESTDSVSTIISGVAAWMSSGKDAECEYGAKELQKMIERNEQAVDYFYALGEEFAGKEKNEARDARLMKRVGYVQESDLPVDEAKANLEVGENIEIEEKTVEVIDKFIREKLGCYGKAMCLMVVVIFAIVGVVLFLMSQDRFSATDVFVALGFAFFIGLVIFLSWPESLYDAASEDFNSIRAASTEHDCE